MGGSSENKEKAARGVEGKKNLGNKEGAGRRKREKTELYFLIGAQHNFLDVGGQLEKGNLSVKSRST